MITASLLFIPLLSSRVLYYTLLESALAIFGLTNGCTDNTALTNGKSQNLGIHISVKCNFYMCWEGSYNELPECKTKQHSHESSNKTSEWKSGPYGVYFGLLAFLRQPYNQKWCFMGSTLQNKSCSCNIHGYLFLRSRSSINCRLFPNEGGSMLLNWRQHEMAYS